MKQKRSSYQAFAGFASINPKFFRLIPMRHTNPQVFARKNLAFCQHKPKFVEPTQT
jgi:hypothetical protein